MIEQTVSIERMEDAIDIFGSFDENIRIIEQELAVRVVSRDDQLKISGEAGMSGFTLERESADINVWG